MACKLCFNNYTHSRLYCITKISPLQLTGFGWHFRDLYCSQGGKAPCSVRGRVIAISFWTDTGRRTEATIHTGAHASAQRQHLFYPSGYSALLLYVLCLTFLGWCELLLGLMFLCCWCMPHRTAAIQWPVSFGLSREEIVGGAYRGQWC